MHMVCVDRQSEIFVLIGHSLEQCPFLDSRRITHADNSAFVLAGQIAGDVCLCVGLPVFSGQPREQRVTRYRFGH